MLLLLDSCLAGEEHAERDLNLSWENFRGWGKWEKEIKLQELGLSIKWSFMARHAHFYCECFYISAGKLKSICVLIVKMAKLCTWKNFYL